MNSHCLHCRRLIGCYGSFSKSNEKTFPDRLIRRAVFQTFKDTNCQYTSEITSILNCLETPTTFGLGKERPVYRRIIRSLSLRIRCIKLKNCFLVILLNYCGLHDLKYLRHIRIQYIRKIITTVLCKQTRSDLY